MSSESRVPPGSRVSSTLSPRASSAAASLTTCVDLPQPSPPSKVMNLPRAMEELKEAGLWFTGLDWGEDAKPYTKIDFRGKVGLVVGAEGKGISRLVREKCDFIAELPMPGGFESLNAGVAAAVTLYEIIRQRRK